MRKMYFLSFTEEFWHVKPEYENWHIGRVEVYKKDEQWAADELRFATPPTDEWLVFREKWDFKEVDDLTEFKRLLTKFRCR